MSADRQLGRGEQRAGGLRAVGAGEGERTGAELGVQHARHVARRVAEAAGEALDALALDDAVVHEAHRARGEVVVQIPVGGAGHGIRLAALAGAQPGLVRGGGGAVEAHVAGLGRHGGAARAAVDAGGVHAAMNWPSKRESRERERRVARRRSASESATSPPSHRAGRHSTSGNRTRPHAATAHRHDHRGSLAPSVSLDRACRPSSATPCARIPTALDAARADKSGHVVADRPLAVVEAHDDRARAGDDALRDGARHPGRPARRGHRARGRARSAARASSCSRRERMNRILEISVDDELAVVEPGVINGDLNAHARRARPLVRARSGEPRDLDRSAATSPPTPAGCSARSTA